MGQGAGMLRSLCLSRLLRLIFRRCGRRGCRSGRRSIFLGWRRSLLVESLGLGCWLGLLMRSFLRGLLLLGGWGSGLLRCLLVLRLRGLMFFRRAIWGFSKFVLGFAF